MSWTKNPLYYNWVQLRKLVSYDLWAFNIFWDSTEITLLNNQFNVSKNINGFTQYNKRQIIIMIEVEDKNKLIRDRLLSITIFTLNWYFGIYTSTLKT